MDKLIRGFDEQITAVLNTVSSAATQLDGMAKEMNDVASKTNQLSTDASGAVNVASANVETVAAAAEELSKSIQEIGQKVDSSQGIARQAVTEAERTNATVSGLVNATKTGGEVVAIIKSMAEQTKLPALEATHAAAPARQSTV